MYRWMSRTVFPATLLLVLAASMAWTQVVNGGFENWTSGGPVGWTTDNVPGMYTPVTQSTTSHSGSYSLQGTVVSYASMGVPPVASSLSSVGARYANLTGFYRGSFIGGDSLVVAVLMNHQGLTIGGGAFTTGANAGTFTGFTVPLEYISGDTPDTCYILLGMGYVDAPHIGSTFLLDDLAFSGTAVSVAGGRALPSTFQLYQNYPNPFNPVTEIRYDLPQGTHVRLSVYNVLGDEVAVLVDGMQDAGTHQARLDGSRLSSGMYFYRLETPSFHDIRKMILLK